MEQNPSWEANRFLARQEFPHILWNSKVHYYIHKCLPPGHIFSQINPVHALTTHFLKINIHIILLSTPGLLSCLFPSGFPTKTYITYPLPICGTCPVHLILIELIIKLLII